MPVVPSRMIDVRQVHRTHASGARPIAALSGASMEVTQGECIAITGPSGCGKSTLLHLLGGLDRPDAGEIFVAGVALHEADESALTHFRRRTIGIVFQFFNLMPAMTAMENVSLPLLLAGTRPAEARRRALAALDLVGLGDRAAHFPHQMSGGELQRTAIGRALVHEPPVLLADEPTGNLDSVNAGQVLAAFQKISSQLGTTMVIVTHSASVAAAASRRIGMRDGKIAALSTE